MCADCRCENMVFVCLSFSVCHTPGLPAFIPGGHSLNKYCIVVYWLILTLFSPFFSEGIVLIDTLEFPFPSPVGATIFAKLRLKIAKSQKISGKVCAHHLV